MYTSESRGLCWSVNFVNRRDKATRPVQSVRPVICVLIDDALLHLRFCLRVSVQDGHLKPLHSVMAYSVRPDSVVKEHLILALKGKKSQGLCTVIFYGASLTSLCR